MFQDERPEAAIERRPSMASFEAFWPNEAKKTNDYNATPGKMMERDNYCVLLYKIAIYPRDAEAWGEGQSGAAMAKRTNGSEASDRATAAAYLAAITADLASLARGHGLKVLGYLLDMATVEAENISRQADRRE